MNKNEELLPFYQALSTKIYWKDGKPYWLKSYPPVTKDTLAGSLDKNGYRRITTKINNKSKTIKAHRIHWFMHYGEMPPKIIDHFNRIKDDNRIENLREITNRGNGYNRDSAKNSSSKFLGVHKRKEYNGWEVGLKMNGKRKYLGSFPCEYCAAIAYDNALINYGLEEFGNFNLLKQEII